jgi:hypothetical protein
MMIGNESTAISETVMTTPLLSTADFSESATGNGESGTTNHRHRRLDNLDNGGGGGGGASIEQVRAVLNTRPYLRFLLDTKCIPFTLPLALEQNGVTAVQWDDFCSLMKILVQRGEMHEKSFILYAILLCAICVLVFFWMLPLLASLLKYVYQRRKQILVDDIVAYCKESQEAEVIQANGYTLECELLHSEVRGSRLHLFILPVDKPYARFEVYNGWFTCQGWNDTHVNAQASTCTIPPTFDSVPLEDWSSFWVHLRTLYLPQLRLYDLAMKAVIVEMFTLVMALLATVFANTAVIFVILLCGVSVQYVIGVVYLLYQFSVFLGAKTTLVYDSAVRWAPQGVYMEHRRLMHFHPWLGLLERHYVYIFRLANLTDSVDDPDDSRSTASGIRSRQSIGISGSRLSDDPDA